MTAILIPAIPSLENAVEKAYGAVLSYLTNATGANIFGSNLIPILLNSTQFENTPSDNQDAGEDSNKPIPRIELIATAGPESLLGLGVREVKLEIRVIDNASREGSDGFTMDNLFSSAITPLFISNFNDGSGHNFSFEQLLSDQVNNFRCYGFNGAQRIESSEQTKSGSLATRSAVTNLICTNLND